MGRLYITPRNLPELKEGIYRVRSLNSLAYISQREDGSWQMAYPSSEEPFLIPTILEMYFDETTPEIELERNKIEREFIQSHLEILSTKK